MQNTKFLLVVADTLGAALVQLDSILKNQFSKVDCRVADLLIVPEARPARIQSQQMQVVCNLVCVLVSDNPNENWAVPDNADQNKGALKALDTFNQALEESGMRPM